MGFGGGLGVIWNFFYEPLPAEAATRQQPQQQQQLKPIALWREILIVDLRS